MPKIWLHYCYFSQKKQYHFILFYLLADKENVLFKRLSLIFMFCVSMWFSIFFLSFAAYNGDTEFVKALITQGANVNVQHGDYTPILAAGKFFIYFYSNSYI